MARLSYDGVWKVFGDGTVAMEDITLEVPDGEFLVFVGPSGSGKSTFLRVMAGLEPPTRGRVRIDGRDVTDLDARQRDLAMVFQAYALYPHKTVRGNLEFGLRVRGMPPRERADRVEAIARALGIEGLLGRRPAQLSGGQRQRVALGRALVREPRAFLLDEPLSNLDPALRLRARTELARLHRRLGATFLYVTHDQEEAISLGDRVAVLRRGRIEQVAPPMELYRRPATRFVAEFIGSPAMNLHRCRMEDGALVGPGYRFLPGDAGLPPGVRDRLGTREPARREVLLGIRPHDVTVEDGAPDAGPVDATGVVDVVEPRGSDLLVRLRLDGARASDGSGDPDAPRASDTDLAVVLPSDRPVREGARLRVELPRDRLHWFDPETGLRL